MKHPNTYCPCCEIFDHKEEICNTFLICPICDWEDDGVQLNNPDYEGGANTLSLNQARKMFKKNQTCEGNHFIFMSKPSEFEVKNSCVVHIPKVNGVKHLFEELSEKLCFPNYFGRNWDAANDCLNDLMWIHEESIVIVHDSSINLEEKDFNIYIEILYNTVFYRLSDRKRILKVVFRTDYKDFIDHFIKNK